MSDERTRRVGENQALYRHANEQIKDLNDAFAQMTDAFEVVCECGDLGCADHIAVSREKYEQIRARPELFIVKPGHEVAGVERIVEQTAEYAIIEKSPREAVRLAEETDPRP